MKIILLFSFLTLTSFSLWAQEYTLSGQVKDAENGELLIGATIFAKNVRLGTITNEYGYFSLSLPAGDYEIYFHYLGFEDVHNSYP